MEHFEAWRALSPTVPALIRAANDSECSIEDMGLTWNPITDIAQLKSREIGSTEIYIRRFLHMQRRMASGDIIIVPDTEEHSINVIEQARMMILSAPSGYFPALVRSSQTDLVFEDGTGIYGLPGTVSAARSERGRFFLCTEQAFWEDAEEQWRGLQGAIAALPEGERTYIVIESTADGVGNLFHRIYTGAKQRANGFQARFNGWLDNPYHTMAWREQTESRMAETPHLIASEYPETEEQAFIESSRVFFPVWFRPTADGLLLHDVDQHTIVTMPDDALHAYTQRHGAPRGRNTWMPTLNPSGYPEELQYLIRHYEFAQERDQLDVWFPPEAGRSYVIGADVALGLEDGDYDDATVLDYETCEEVAHLRGHWTPQAYAEMLYVLQRAYFGVLAVERNGYGQAVVDELVRTWGMDHPELYHTADKPNPSRVQIALEELGRAGFDTNVRTRPVMLSGLRWALQQDYFRPRSDAFWDERQTFIRDDKGRGAAPKGYHDDAIMSAAIALHVRGGVMPIHKRERVTYA